jgi:hypothetical protein
MVSWIDLPLNQTFPLTLLLQLIDLYLFPSHLSSNSYIPPTFLSCLKRTDLIEYRQANLQILATVSSVFDPPADSDFPFDIVYDLSGEKAYDRPEIVSPYFPPSLQTFPLTFRPTLRSPSLLLPAEISRPYLLPSLIIHGLR